MTDTILARTNMLKLGTPRNAYDLLGLPRSATWVQVLARYRQLVRHHQKELPTSQLLQDERFRRWTNAYLLLTSPERREYDQRLRRSRGREQPPDMLAGLPAARLLLIEAQAAYMRRKLNEAADVAKQAVKQEPRNAEVYALLGDILREQARYDKALTMYNYAIQFDPSNRRYWQLLQEVTALREGRALPKRYTREIANPLNRPPSAWVAIGLTIIFVELNVWYLQGRWGDPVFLNIPVNTIYAALGNGFLIGLVLAGTAVLGPFDDELINYQIAAFGTQMAPVGIFVLFPGIIFFWAAVVFYAIGAWLDEYFSLSVIIALAVCAGMTTGLGFLAPESARPAVFLLGGNFIFFGFALGWLFGSVRAHVFEH